MVSVKQIILGDWDKETNVFDHLPVGPCAFACLNILNNHDLWTERTIAIVMSLTEKMLVINKREGFTQNSKQEGEA